MGKQLNLLRKLIKEELEISLAEETTDKPSSNGADYDQFRRIK
jgi:hypothetical protein